MNYANMALYIRRAIKGNFFSKLVQTNSGYSSKSFFLIIVTIVGTLLLCVPVFALCIEAWYNHTITTDLSAMAAYIAAVAGVFTSVGLTKVWSEKYEHRLPGPDGKLGTDDDMIINVTDEEYNKIVNAMNKCHCDEHNDDDRFGPGMDNDGCCN